MDFDALIAQELAAYAVDLKVPDASEIKRQELEAQGWRPWLLTLFPFWFSENFSEEHEQYWELHWSALMRIRAGEEVPNKELVKLLLLGRGLGKSSVLEGARVMRGALLNGGYSLIISETDDQAQEHLGNCRILIEHPDSKLTEYYPDMSIAEQSDVLKGMPTADRKEMFICKNGYICRGKGLSAKMRGLRVGINRPDDIAFDDVDDVNDSLAVSSNKLKLITASILPVQARHNVTIDVGQNLISEHSVVNQIYSGKTDALADRTVIGVANAFTDLHIDSEIDETGKMRHKIRETSQPSWAGFSVIRAQKFLDNSGLSTFMAEYQNEFNQFHSGKVIPEYNEKAQVITWSQFEQIFGERRIPRHWKVLVGLDIGYSEGQYPHYSAWDFLATAAMNSPLPNAVFLYRSKSFKGTSIDDQAEEVLAEMYDDEREMVTSWQMSHERTGEMLTLWQKHKLPFGKFRHYKAEDGVAQWRHMSRCDHSKPNPFKPDFKSENGLFTIGRPTLFYIVDDVQILQSFDDKGLHLFRNQVSTWEYVPVKLTETGQNAQRPSKVNDDHCFIAGTMIKALDGDKPIEDITLDDKVLTRYGYESVLASAKTQENAQTYTITCTDGTQLTGTGNHPIFLSDGTTKCLRYIESGDILFGCQKLLNQKKSSLMGSRSTVIQNPSNPPTAITTKRNTPVGNWASRLYTLQYGKMLTDKKYLKAIKSTIGTIIRSIIPSTIWNALQRNNTLNTTWTMHPKNIGIYCVNHLLRADQKQSRGIKVKKAGRGIVRLLSKIGNTGSTYKKIAVTVENLLKQKLRQIGQRLAPLNALLNTVSGDLSLDNMRLADNVGSNLWSLPSPDRFVAMPARNNSRSNKELSRSNVKGVKNNLQPLAEIKSSALVVAKISIDADKADVYNLTVANHPEYFANGILVHNCDVVKSLLAYFGATATELTKQEKLVAEMPDTFKKEDLTEKEKVQQHLWMQRRLQEEQQKTQKPSLPTIPGRNIMNWMNRT